VAGPNVQVPRVVEATPPELVVYDRQQTCPYLKDQVARLPLRLPSRPLSAEELGARLQGGDRRQGFVLYRPHCPTCTACEPIRLTADTYNATRSQKRILKRGNENLTMSIAPPTVDGRRVAIYNAHKAARDLRDGQPPIDEDGYRDFLVASCCDTFEISYHHEGQLVGVAICDRAHDAVSAVYCCYDPEFSHLGIGTYSILKQLELCVEWRLPYLYLGLYIQRCDSMEYKARFRPHERLIEGEWIEFERG
jgi:arginyl-tRNA--protein-N-Asp/Glu arginylyltransferase